MVHGSEITSQGGSTHKHAHTKNLFMSDGQNIGIGVASVQTFTVRHLAAVIWANSGHGCDSEISPLFQHELSTSLQHSSVGSPAIALHQK